MKSYSRSSLSTLLLAMVIAVTLVVSPSARAAGGSHGSRSNCQLTNLLVGAAAGYMIGTAVSHRTSQRSAIEVNVGMSSSPGNGYGNSGSSGINSAVGSYSNSNNGGYSQNTYQDGYSNGTGGVNSAVGSYSNSNYGQSGEYNSQQDDCREGSSEDLRIAIDDVRKAEFAVHRAEEALRRARHREMVARDNACLHTR